MTDAPTWAQTPAPAWAASPAPESALKRGSSAALESVGAYGRGVASSLLGTPGDLAQMALHGADTSPDFPLSSDWWLGKLPGQAAAKDYPWAQTTGRVLGGLASPVEWLRGASALRRGVKAIPDAVSAVAPGATARATGEISKVGPVTDKSALGKRMVDDLRPDYDKAYAMREAELNRVAPGSSYIGADEAAQAKLNRARQGVYNDPKFKDLKDFEESRLGKTVTATTGRYSPVPRLDPHNLPQNAFRSADSVSDLRDLLKSKYPHPQDAVENFAQEHTANSLFDATRGKDIKEAADAGEKWLADNRAWLRETPVTKAMAEHFVQRLRTVAKAQSVARPIAKGAAYGAAGTATGAAVGLPLARRLGIIP